MPFLYNAYGIEMAARTYFDKPAQQLDVLESATLIGMLKGTSYYNPVSNPERSLQRRNTVLGQMVRHNRLAPAKFDELKTEPLGLDFERQTEEIGPAPHLTQQLRRWLIEWADRHGYDIRSDGLVVRTTIDSRLQAMAAQAVTRQADKLQAIADKAWRPAANKNLVHTFLRETAQYRAARDAGESDEQALKKLQSDSALMQSLWQDKTRLQAGFMALDPGNGHVKAWVGSRDFQQDQFDHVAQARRQPGSTFKPFVYGAAFEQGISPGEMLRRPGGGNPDRRAHRLAARRRGRAERTADDRARRPGAVQEHHHRAGDAAGGPAHAWRKWPTTWVCARASSTPCRRSRWAPAR